MEKELNKYMIDDIMAIVVDYVKDPWKLKYNIVMWELSIRNYMSIWEKIDDDFYEKEISLNHLWEKSDNPNYIMQYGLRTSWCNHEYNKLMIDIELFDRSRLKSHNKI